MRPFLVKIRIDGEDWGEYKVYAPNAETAAFVGGMKYQHEEGINPIGKFVEVYVEFKP